MSDPGHQAAVDEFFASSGGTMFFLGTWRTCPYSKPSPTVADKEDWEMCRKRNAKWHPLLFAVVGTEQIDIYFPWGDRFVPLRKQDGSA